MPVVGLPKPAHCSGGTVEQTPLHVLQRWTNLDTYSRVSPRHKYTCHVHACARPTFAAACQCSSPSTPSGPSRSFASAAAPPPLPAACGSHSSAPSRHSRLASCSRDGRRHAGRSHEMAQQQVDISRVASARRHVATPQQLKRLPTQKRPSYRIHKTGQLPRQQCCKAQCEVPTHTSGRSHRHCSA